VTGPQCRLEDDNQTVTITFSTEPPVAMKLTTADVDNMLQNLGAYRGEMKPVVPATLALGEKVAAVPDPNWATELDAMMGDSLLHLRDPRFGWLHYLLSKDGARKLGDLLLKQADAPPPGLGQGRAN
jgi:hypothetical protein